MTTGVSEKKAETEAHTESKVAREVQAQIVTSLQSLLEGDEQILAFTRGTIAGGLKGKLSVGIEAIFAPVVNVGLTDRRVILQHIHPNAGTPSQILPHMYSYGEVAAIQFTDIETFGKAPAARIVIHLHNDQYFRVRVAGTGPVKGAKTLTKVFASIISKNPVFTQSAPMRRCLECEHPLDSLSKFCPYCGAKLVQNSSVASEFRGSPAKEVYASSEARPEASESHRDEGADYILYSDNDIPKNYTTDEEIL